MRRSAPYHGELILLLRAHRGNGVDRSFTDRHAEVSGARNAANEDEIEAETSQKIGDRADDVGVAIPCDDQMHVGRFY